MLQPATKQSNAKSPQNCISERTPIARTSSPLVTDKNPRHPHRLGRTVLGHTLANGLLNKALREHAERLQENRLSEILRGRGGRRTSLQRMVAEISRIMGDTLFLHIEKGGRTVKHEQHLFVGLYPDDRPLSTINMSAISITGKNPHDFKQHDLDFCLSRHACVRLIQGTHEHIHTAMTDAMRELNNQVREFFQAKEKLAHLKYESLADTVIETYTRQGVGIWQMEETAILKTFIPLTSLEGRKLQRLRSLGKKARTHSFLCRADAMILQLT